MTEAALALLIEHAGALIAALDGDDPGRIHAAGEDLRASLGGVAAADDRRPAMKAGIAEALRLAEAAGARINYLADRDRRRLDRLAALTGAPRAIAYGRAGRLG